MQIGVIFAVLAFTAGLYVWRKVSLQKRVSREDHRQLRRSVQRFKDQYKDL